MLTGRILRLVPTVPLLLAAVIAMSGCAVGRAHAAPAVRSMTIAKAAPASPAAGDDAAGREGAAPEADDGVVPADKASPSAEGQAAAPAKRMVIYDATLEVAVFKPERVLARARKLAKEAGGWMASMTRRSLVLRVPAAKLEPLLDQLAELGDVVARQVRGRDVTEALLDLTIRLQNALKVRERLVALLQQAKTVKDSVLIERELGRLTERIERLKGKLEYLQNHVSFSTLTFKLQLKSAHSGRTRRLPFHWLRELGVDQLVSY